MQIAVLSPAARALVPHSTRPVWHQWGQQQQQREEENEEEEEKIFKPSSTARRRLFPEERGTGSAEAEEQNKQFVQRLLAEIAERYKQKWGFDFEEGRPLEMAECRYRFERVPSEQVPGFYHTTTTTKSKTTTKIFAENTKNNNNFSQFLKRRHQGETEKEEVEEIEEEEENEKEVALKVGGKEWEDEKEIEMEEKDEEEEEDEDRENRLQPTPKPLPTSHPPTSLPSSLLRPSFSSENEAKLAASSSSFSPTTTTTTEKSPFRRQLCKPLRLNSNRTPRRRLSLNTVGTHLLWGRLAQEEGQPQITEFLSARKSLSSRFNAQKEDEEEVVLVENIGKREETAARGEEQPESPTKRRRHSSSVLEATAGREGRVGGAEEMEGGDEEEENGSPLPFPQNNNKNWNGSARRSLRLLLRAAPSFLSQNNTRAE